MKKTASLLLSPFEVPETENQNAIVVYFSSTGNTERAAQYISDLTGAKLYPLTPVEPYTADDLDFNDESSRVVQEYEHPDKRDIQLSNSAVPDWDSYDTVYLGYPIWWFDAAWPIDNFVKHNIFTGKTVYPFCTSESSPAGDSGSNLQAMTKTGVWKPAERFAQDVTEQNVQDWLESIGQE